MLSVIKLLGRTISRFAALPLRTRSHRTDKDSRRLAADPPTHSHNNSWDLKAYTPKQQARRILRHLRQQQQNWHSDKALKRPVTAHFLPLQSVGLAAGVAMAPDVENAAVIRFLLL